MNDTIAGDGTPTHDSDTHGTDTDNVLQSLFNALTADNSAAGRPRLCAACVQDWAVAPSLLCGTCIEVDDLLAATAGSRHFLPHIWTRMLHEQPQDVMACALHKLLWPHDTGFYGVYTTMAGLLRRAGAARLAEARAHGADLDKSATEAAAAVQPSRARSLAMLVEVSTCVFPETADWLGTAVEQVRRRCEELDAQSPVTLTDYQRAQIAAVLR